jgi:hypothetical protein
MCACIEYIINYDGMCEGACCSTTGPSKKNLLASCVTADSVCVLVCSLFLLFLPVILDLTLELKQCQRSLLYYISKEHTQNGALEKKPKRKEKKQTDTNGELI